MKQRRRRKCQHCGRLYRPDPRNRYHQRYCSAAVCQTASRRTSQLRWLALPGNENYFRGPDQVARVRAWRAKHPRYWRKKPGALQDVIAHQPVDNEVDKPDLIEPALQDVFLTQPALLVGVIATLAGSALQEEIVRTIRQMHHRGQAILDPKFGIETKGTHDAVQTGVMSGPTAAGTRAVQLGGSAAGAHGVYPPV